QTIQACPPTSLPPIRASSAFASQRIGSPSLGLSIGGGEVRCPNSPATYNYKGMVGKVPTRVLSGAQILGALRDYHSSNRCFSYIRLTCRVSEPKLQKARRLQGLVETLDQELMQEGSIQA